MLKSKEAFYIPFSIRLSKNNIVTLKRQQIQGDQESELNIISMSLEQKLGLPLLNLDLVGFRNLTIHTVDHNNKGLKYKIWLEVEV